MSGQLLFIGPEPAADIRVLHLADTAGFLGGPLWFRWKGDWVRQAWCGQFPDRTPRPPWLDEQFNRLWETEGPEAARDKSRFDLSEIEAAQKEGPL